MISSTRCTSLGERPSDGSSIRMSVGLAIRARPIASICCSPPRERAARIVEPLGELRKFPSTLRASSACGPATAGDDPRRKRAGRQRKILAHRERFEDAPALRNDRDAGLRDRVGRLARERAAVEDHVAAARRRQPGDRADQRGLAHAVAAEDARRSRRAQLEAQPVQHVAVAVVGVDVAHGEQRVRRGQNRPPAPARCSAPRPACRRE